MSSPFGVDKKSQTIMVMLEEYVEAKKTLETGHNGAFSTERNLMLAEEAIGVMLDNVRAIRACYKPDWGQS